MNRRTLLASALVTASLPALLFAQGIGESDALQWTWKVEPAAGDEVTLVAIARIDEGYIVYGSDFKSGLGPRPSRLRIADGNLAVPEGAFESVAARHRADAKLGIEYTYFEHRAEFRQKLRRPAGATRITGRIEGQTCYEKDGTCTLFRAPFDVALP